MSRHSQRAWRPVFTATHVSRNTGAQAMLIAESETLIVLMDETGQTLTDQASEWKGIPDV